MKVDRFRLLPRSFRPLYEGRGPFPGDEDVVWAPFGRRVAESRIALLTSAGLYLKATQDSFDLRREQTEPEWGDLDVSSPARWRSEWNDTSRLAVAKCRWP